MSKYALSVSDFPDHHFTSLVGLNSIPSLVHDRYILYRLLFERPSFERIEVRTTLKMNGRKVRRKLVYDFK